MVHGIERALLTRSFTVQLYTAMNRGKVTQAFPHSRKPNFMMKKIKQVIAWMFNFDVEQQSFELKLKLAQGELADVKGKLEENKSKFETEIIRLKKENKAHLVKIENLMNQLADAEKKLSAVSAAGKPTKPGGKTSNPKPGKVKKEQ